MGTSTGSRPAPLVCAEVIAVATDAALVALPLSCPHLPFASQNVIARLARVGPQLAKRGYSVHDQPARQEDSSQGRLVAERNRGLLTPVGSMLDQHPRADRIAVEAID